MRAERVGNSWMNAKSPRNMRQRSPEALKKSNLFETPMSMSSNMVFIMLLCSPHHVWRHERPSNSFLNTNLCPLVPCKLKLLSYCRPGISFGWNQSVRKFDTYEMVYYLVFLDSKTFVIKVASETQGMFHQHWWSMDDNFNYEWNRVQVHPHKTICKTASTTRN